MFSGSAGKPKGKCLVNDILCDTLSRCDDIHVVSPQIMEHPLQLVFSKEMEP